MNSLPQSVEEFEQLLKTDVSLDVPAYIDHLKEQHNLTESTRKLVKRVQKLVLELVKLRLESDIKNSTVDSFFLKIENELSYRLNIQSPFQIDYIQPVMAEFFTEAFVKHLKEAISKNFNIEKLSFCFSYKNDFLNRFCVEDSTVHDLKLLPLLNQYFPNYDFHTQQARKKRIEMDKTRFQRELLCLDQALSKGAAMIAENHNSGKFEAGTLAEDTWVEVMTVYFGNQFNIYQNKMIHVNGKPLAKFDIVMTLRDDTHTTPAVTHYINSEDVVAAFEVKRTLKSSHVALNNDAAIKIFDTDCLQLKKSVMPEHRSVDSELTPYQMLRGKIYFGVLCLDVDKKNDPRELLRSGKNHLERHRNDACLRQLTERNEQYTDYAPDIVFCPNKLLWLKETKLRPRSFSDEQLTFFVQEGDNAIDKSASTFGYLIASIRHFFVGQGHIPKSERQAYLKDYQHFGLLKSETSQSRVTLNKIDNKWPRYITDLDTYLRTAVPNEYSCLFLSQRQPLAPLNKFSSVEVQDISSHVKRELKRIVKLELNTNYHPLPAGVTPDDESFDAYFNTLFAS